MILRSGELGVSLHVASASDCKYSSLLTTASHRHPEKWPSTRGGGGGAGTCLSGGGGGEVQRGGPPPPCQNMPNPQ